MGSAATRTRADGAAGASGRGQRRAVHSDPKDGRVPRSTRWRRHDREPGGARRRDGDGGRRPGDDRGVGPGSDRPPTSGAGLDARRLQARSQARRGRHGRGVRGPQGQARPVGRAQGAVGHSRGPPVSIQARVSSARGRQARQPDRARRAGRAAQRPGVLHDGAGRRRVVRRLRPRRHPRGPAAQPGPARARARSADRRCPPPPPRPLRPPGSQAFERAGHPRGAGGDPRLWGRLGAVGGRRRHDPRRPDDGHAGLHGAGASRR
ncbi:hypothetical protein ENSA7_48290 [Enhygromyxa salina]|uniref:Uncharacterized protein n=1 Tax=Enhygromyxa salina TaxID=215803 RepID=A0A2S9YIF6_9BACT|nr:hypothetical protein ENSA7_48290 [Enhygromyxa salina]